MKVLLFLGIAWTLYGIAGFFGIQRIAQRYRNQSWTKEYCRACGIGWIIIGIPWILFYIFASEVMTQWPVMTVLLIVLSIPSIIYSAYMEKKYQAKLDETEAQKPSQLNKTTII